MSSAAEQALQWIEEHIAERQLTVGDALPAELEIAAATGVGRSSVREALTALKVLGIIQSKRKGGIRIVRDPVLLELRHYFDNDLDAAGRYADAMEFRAALEWGLGPLALARIKKKTIRQLRRLLREVAAQPSETVDVMASEIRFHWILTAGCGNRLAALFAHLYGPIFQDCREARPRPRSAVEITAWLEQHGEIVDALEAGDEQTFLKALKRHTHVYMRWPETTSKQAGSRSR